MKMNVVRTVRGSVMALLMLSVLWFLPTTSQAAVVTQLDITGEPASCKAVLISALRHQRWGLSDLPLRVTSHSPVRFQG